MKKKTIIAVILCIIIAVGTVLTVLIVMNRKNGGERNSAATVNNHCHSVTETNGYFLKDGKTDYKLLLPDSADDNIGFAAQDFNRFFKEATGVELPVLYDGKADVDNGKYISLGDTKLFAKSGITADKSLTTSGFILKSKNDDILVAAYSSKSIIYGMQELLKYFINWEYFGTDCYRYNKNVKDIKLCNFDVREVADIEYRFTNYGYMVKTNLYNLRNKEYVNRARLEYMYTEITGPGDHVGHNNLYYAPLDKYFNSHPKWYTGDKLNISYVANGDKEEYKTLVDHFAEEMKKIIKTYPQKLIMCTIEDAQQFDPCAAQSEIAKKYNGSNAASIILFLNDVNRKVKEWMNTDEGKPYEKDYYIVFLGYQPTEKAPAYVDDNGNVTLIDGLKCDPEVVVQYAPIYQDFTHSIYSEENKYYFNNLKAWSKVCDNVFVWNYVIDYSNYFCFFDSFDYIADGVRSCKEAGVRFIYHEHGGSGNAATSCFDSLRVYLEMKLGWNSSLEPAVLIDEFFDAYYGVAAEEMKKLFIETRAWANYLKDNEIGYDGPMSNQNHLKLAKFWPKRLLLNWLKTANEAESKIITLKSSDPVSYDLYYKHIATERLSYYYLLIELYGDELSEENISEYKRRFKADSDYIGGARVVINGDNATVESTLYPIWGI